MAHGGLQPWPHPRAPLGPPLPDAQALLTTVLVLYIYIHIYYILYTIYCIYYIVYMYYIYYILYIYIYTNIGGGPEFRELF